MRSRTAVLAALLAIAPLAAQSADLVVWWDKGYYAEEGDAIDFGVSDPALRALQPREPPCRRDGRAA